MSEAKMTRGLRAALRAAVELAQRSGIDCAKLPESELDRFCTFVRIEAKKTLTLLLGADELVFEPAMFVAGMTGAKRFLGTRVA